MKTYTTADFQKWGAIGAKNRKRFRKLTRKQAQEMNRARQEKRRKKV